MNKVIVEITGADHEKRLKLALEQAGYAVVWDLGSEFDEKTAGPGWKPMTHGWSHTQVLAALLAS